MSRGLPPGDSASAGRLLLEKLEGLYAEAADLSSDQKVLLRGYALGLVHGIRAGFRVTDVLGEGGSFEESFDQFYTSLAVQLELMCAEVRRGCLP